MSPVFLSAVVATQTFRPRGQGPASPSPKRERSDLRYKLSYMLVALSVVLLIIAGTIAALTLPPS